MIRIASKLTHMIDVIDHRLERGLCGLLITRYAPRPLWIEHPRIKSRANNPAAFDNRADHIICQLSLPRRQCPAIVMACSHRPIVIIENFPESLIGRMRHIHNNSRGFERVEQWPAPIQQSPFCPRSMAIRTYAIMRNTHHFQAQIAPFGHLIGIENRIRALHCQHQPDGRICRRLRPRRNACVQILNRVNLPDNPPSLHRLVKSVMPHPDTMTLRLVPHPRARPAVIGINTRHHRAKNNPHAPLVQLGKRGRTRPKTARRRFRIVYPHGCRGLREIAVDLNGAKGEV